MQDLKRPEKDKERAISTQIPDKRSGQERRKGPSCGYTCISMVGWICRREQFRRKKDPDCFNNDKP